MKIFITGATGLLGTNTVKSALDHGHEVIALARDPEKARRVLPQVPEVTIVSGDISNPEPWLSELRNADWVIHAAAYFREYFHPGDHSQTLKKLNVDFPLQFIRACENSGVNKILVVSSSGALSPYPDGRPADEQGHIASRIPGQLYFQSKAEMEIAISSLNPKPAIPIIIARPGWMFGPEDSGPTTAGEMVTQIIKTKKFQMVAGKPQHIADARDVAEGLIRALETYEESTAINLVGQEISVIEAIREVAKNVPGANVEEVPYPAAMFLSTILEPISKLQGKPNPIPKAGLITLNSPHPIQSQKYQELGLTWRPFTETARDTVAYFTAKNSM